MWFRSCQNEFGVGRWLLQGLKEGIGGFFSYHVDFVYNVDLVVSQIWGIIDFFSQVTDFINAPVAGGVYLDDIRGTTFVDSFTHGAAIARFALLGVQAANCFSQNASGAGLSCASWTTEKIGMSHPSISYSVAQCLGNMLLSYYFRQCLGAPFAVKDLRGHDALIIPHVC